MRRLGFFLAWILLVALPLQGMAASAMLLCGAQPHEHGGARTTQHAHHGPGGHHHAGHGQPSVSHDHAATPGDSGTSPLDDLKCSACAACCIGAAISHTPQLASLLPTGQAAAAPASVPLRVRATPPPDKPPRA